MKTGNYLQIFFLMILISMMNMDCMFIETADNSSYSEIETSDVETSDVETQLAKENENTYNPYLRIKSFRPIPQSINPGKSIQMTLSVESNCPPTTPEEIHIKCHDNCTQGLRYAWESACAGTFNDRNSEDPVFTPASDLASESCIVSVLIKNKCTQLSASVPLFIVKENSKPVIDSLVADKNAAGRDESIQLKVEAHDPDNDSLQYVWTSTCSGSFNDATLPTPEFTVSNTAPYGICQFLAEVHDGTNSVSGVIQINIIETIINESPVILSIFQNTDIIIPGQVITFIVRAKDPEMTALSFAWSGSSGTFDESLETINEKYTESIVNWTSPDCGEEPITIKVVITDADGRVTEKSYIPITLIGGNPCP